MSTPEMPFQGDGFDDDPPSYEWLDEWLCEYVDGTMDPSLEAVFEEYVEANPELKAHVERLRQTRELLCNCGMPEEASPETQTEVCSEVECDMLRSSTSLSEVASERPVATLGLASTVAMALVIGFLAGSMYVEGPSSSSGPAAEAVPLEPSATEAPSPGIQLPDRSAQPSGIQAVTRRTGVPLSTSDSVETSTMITTFEGR